MSTVFEDLGVVEQIVGAPVAISPDGQETFLIPGDQVKVGWTIQTDDQSSLTVQVPNGARFDIGRNSDFVLSEGEATDQLLVQVADESIAPTDADLLDAELIQALIAAGADPTAIAEATAAGPAAGAPGSGVGGTSTNQVSSAGVSTTPGTDFATQGSGPAFLAAATQNQNLAPVGEDISIALTEDQGDGTPFALFGGTILVSDPDNLTPDLSVSFVVPEVGGVFSLPDGTVLEPGPVAIAGNDFNGLLFTPTENGNDVENDGPIVIEYLVTDPEGASDPGTVTVTIEPVNDAPEIHEAGETLPSAPELSGVDSSLTADITEDEGGGDPDVDSSEPGYVTLTVDENGLPNLNGESETEEGEQREFYQRTGTVEVFDVDSPDTVDLQVTGVQVLDVVPSEEGATTQISDRVTEQDLAEILSWITLSSSAAVAEGDYQGQVDWTFLAPVSDQGPDESTEEGQSTELEDLSGGFERTFDFLADGEQLQIVYDLQANDSADGVPNGTSDTAQIVITITGTNDAPVISVGEDNSTAVTLNEDEDTDSETEGQQSVGTGTLTVTDVDFTDSVTVSASGPTVDTTSESGEELVALFGDLTELFTVSPSEVIGENATTGQVTWTFDGSTLPLDALAAGEEVTLTYAVTVTDETGETATQNVVVTVTGTNDAPTSENFSVNLENGFADINFDPHVADVEDDFLPDDGRVLDEVRIDGLPTFGTLIDNDGNPISAGDMVSLDEVTYVANPTIDLSDEVSGGFALGYTGGDAGASLDNWGVDNGGVREYDLGGVTVTTSVSAGTLTQYNNDEGDGGHIGNGIADDSGQGLNQGDLLTVDFGGVGVTSVNLGLDGLGGHFGPGGSSATVTVVYADGSAETFDYNKANGGDDEFLAVSLTAGSDNPIASLQFTTTEGGGFTGSNWELRYVEVPSNSIVLDDTFTYTPEDSDGAFGNTSTVTINGLESFDNTPPTISQGGPKLMGGLLSEFYVSDSQIGNLEQFKQLIADNDPEALFISTGLSYGLGYGDVGQGTNLEGFLNDDAASLTVGADQRPDSNDAGVRIFGDVSLNAGTYVLKVRADDGFEINIGGQTVAGHPNNQAPKTSYHEFTLTEGGALPIEVLWWDQGGRYVLEVDIAEGSIGDSDLDFQAFAHSEQSPWCHQLVETNSGLVTMGVLDIGDINAAQVVTVSLGEEDPTVVSDWDGATGIDFSGMLNLVGDSNVLDHSETADQMYYVFDSGSEAFDGLDYGETITVTYQVFATDGGATTEGSISVEIQGTNDKPAFSVSPVTRLVLKRTAHWW